MEAKVSILDSTHRFEWEVTKQKFETYNFQESMESPVFNVQMGSEKSKWMLALCPKGLQEKNRNNVFMGLKLLPADVNYNVKVGFRVKTKGGYWPNDFVEDLYGNKSHSVLSSQVKTFDGNGFLKNRKWHTQISSTEIFRGLFIEKKVTVVAVLVIYAQGKVYLQHKERADNFVDNLRSLSRLELLSDFIICGDKQFKCHRAVLASMSSVFQAMLENEMFMEKHENFVKIDDFLPEIVQAMLEFMSTGDIPEGMKDKALDLIRLADKYDLQDLVKVCESSLADNISVQNVIESLIVLDLTVPKSQHRQKLINFIKTEADHVVKHKDWKNFLQHYPDLVTEIFLALAHAAVY